MSAIQLSSLEPFCNSEIPLGTNFLLMGPPGVGKTVFSENILGECIMSKIKILYIALDSIPNDIITRLNERKINIPTEKGKLVFVDGRSWLIGSTSEDYHVNNLSNLSDLSVKIISASSEFKESIFFIFDSISTLLVYNSENDVERFIEANFARMKHAKHVGLWVVEQGIHSEKFYNALRHMSDGILEMRFEEGEELRRFIRMHTFKDMPHDTKWKPLVVSKDGMVGIGEAKQL